MKEFTQDLIRILGEENVRTDEPMDAHTSFRIGGPADYFVTPVSREMLTSTIALCKERGVDFTVIGNGTNLLVGDGGYRGVIIQLWRNFNEITVSEDGTIEALAGAMMSGVAKKAFDNGLAGLEFASGIPGTLGGGVIMNAGAYGGEIRDVCREVEIMTQDGEIRTISGEEMQFGYRTSFAMKMGYIVLSAKLVLPKGDPKEIQAKMDDFRERRTSKQPLTMPSAGSTFKRPEGHFAGKLIMDAGLRGYSIGGAQVSEKHCGFVVNKGGATAKDVTDLMSYIQAEVKRQFDVELEAEVRRLGEFK